jgi:hypothetical protein
LHENVISYDCKGRNVQYIWHNHRPIEHVLLIKFLNRNNTITKN